MEGDDQELRVLDLSNDVQEGCLQRAATGVARSNSAACLDGVVVDVQR